MLRARLQSIRSPLQQDEFQSAETILWKQAQAVEFPNEVYALKRSKTKRTEHASCKIEKSSLLYKLTPVIDERGVIRVGGRLQKAEYLPFDTKYPIILPKNNIVTLRLIQHYHEQHGHANRETVFNELRQRFYIPSLRAVIRKVMNSCVWCRVYRCKPRVPREAPLPVPRVTARLRPFSAVGVDYLGPIEVTVGRRKEKRYIAVFTCLAVRAVHVEVVYSLTTQSCLMAIRRFCCKRGVPEEFVSDNATNFKSASKDLQCTINDECAERVTTSRTKWSFIPPGTPHMGGAWERMVRSVKEALKVLSDGEKLNDEILITALAQHHNNLDEVVDLAEGIRDLYKRSQYLAQQMWVRWSKEYLPSINFRTKWFEDSNSLRVGDLVFVMEGTNRRNWTRGIVQQVFPGSDGRIRQVSVMTSRGVFKRAVANLARMEICDGKSGTVVEPVPELREGDCYGTTA